MCQGETLGNLCKITFHYSCFFLCRQDFERGGFVPDIVGRLVSLNLDKKAMEAKDVAVQLEEEEGQYVQFPTDDYDADEDCHGLDYHHSLVAWASSFDSDMQTLSADNVLELSLWVPHLPHLALHRRGSRTLLMLLKMIPTVPLPMEVLEDALHLHAKALSSNVNTLCENHNGLEVNLLACELLLSHRHLCITF